MVTNRSKSPLGVLRLIAFIFMLISTAPLISSALFYQTALLTGGVVLEFDRNEAFLQPAYTPVLAFSDYQRQKFVASPDSALGSDALRRGEEVRILYDPVNPENFRLDTPLGLWGSSLIQLLLGVVPFLIITRLAGAKRQLGPARRPSRASTPRSKTLEPTHLIRHDSSRKNERSVVRRMR